MSRNASKDELYFVTLTLIDWIDVFTRLQYSDLLIENLAYCQQHKNLNIYAYQLVCPVKEVYKACPHLLLQPITN